MAKRKKLKKLMKVLGAGAAIAGLGRAFMNRNARASTNADAIKAMTSDQAMRGNIYTDAIMRRQPLGGNNMMTPQDMANDPMFTEAMAKDGGKIVKTEKGGKAVRRKKKIGIQIKGFGKARR